MDRYVEYTSNSGKTRVYRVLGSYTDTIMYGVHRGAKVRCLKLEKPWAPGEWFGAQMGRCVDVPAPERRLRQHEDIPVEQAEYGATYAHLGGEPIDEEDAYERARWHSCQERGVPF